MVGLGQTKLLVCVAFVLKNVVISVSLFKLLLAKLLDKPKSV